MNNYGFTGRILSRKLKADTIRKGGLETVITPILLCHIGNELERVSCVAFGGYTTFLNYNKYREEDYKKNKQNKRLRNLKKQIKRLSYCNIGEDFPSPVMTFSIRKENIKK